MKQNRKNDILSDPPTPPCPHSARLLPGTSELWTHSSGFPHPDTIFYYFHNSSAVDFLAACFSTNQSTQDNFLNLIFLQTMSYVFCVIYTWNISQVQLKLDHLWHLFTLNVMSFSSSMNNVQLHMMSIHSYLNHL